MSTNAQTMLDQIDAALAKNAGIAEIRFADGRTLTFDRAQLLAERAHWQTILNQQNGSGIAMCRLGLRGDG